MTASNTLITPSIIAKEALRLLDNNLVLGKLVNRVYEDEFARKVNGFKVGSTVQVDRPVRYTVRQGATASVQNSISSTVDIAVNVQQGVDLQFSTSDLTLNVSRFSEKYMKSAMIQLANSVDQAVAALYSKVWNWVGTPGVTITTIPGFLKAPQRLDEMAVPVGERVGYLSPADRYGLIGNITGLYVQGDNKKALERAQLPPIGDVDCYDSQNVGVHTNGPWAGLTGGAATVNGSTQGTAFTGGSNYTNSQSLNIAGFTASAAAVVAAGDVFTIQGVYAVNPVTKQQLPYLQQFTVLPGTYNADGSGHVTLTVSPQLITSGAYQTVSNDVTSGNTVQFLGSANTAYNQNIVFHRDAFALCCVPMAVQEGMVNPARESYKGLSVRVVPYYDGVNDLGNWRLDILYGVAAIYPDLATRLSGT
jgi:coat protein Gp5